MPAYVGPRNASVRRQASAASSGRWVGPVGVVDEAVLGAGVDDDLAVVAVAPTRPAAPRCRRAGVHGSSLAEDRERRARVGGGVERLVLLRAAPLLRRRGSSRRTRPRVEPPGGRGLERVHAAHAEAEHRDLATTSSSTTSRSAARLRSPSCAASSRSCTTRHAPRDVAQVDARRRGAGRTAPAHTPRARGSRGGGTGPRTAGGGP